ncbi:MAG: GHMP kinase [Armatimonadota bacterium]|nr:GHMP kinase [Armatimonadota bacterium]MDW8025413.1 GHMP kinase [Armatimonadota bacterium]
MKDVVEFEALVKGEVKGFFDGVGDLVITRAPGRIDVMGGIADYSGSVVFEGNISEACMVAIQRRNDPLIRLWSYGIESDGLQPKFELSISALQSANGWLSYEDAHNLLTGDAAASWVAYPIGTLFVLLKEGVLSSIPHGFNIFIRSDVPMGAGVSSSAAIEVSTMMAFNILLNLRLDGLTLARLCQMAENHVVGAPCGIMDQVTSALCEEGKLLALKCQPHELLGLHEIPKGCMVVGVDSNVKHAVGGRRYRRTRVGAFMGFKIIKQISGNDYGGYLCNVSTKEYVQRYRKLLPSKMRGEEFLRKYGETDDVATKVDPNEVYSVRGCTEHPIYENERVQSFIALLDEANRTGDERLLVRAGKLMYASHWSYSKRAGLGCEETDLLVSLARSYGTAHGIYGAKITGGGSGGTVAMLIRDDAIQTVMHIAEEYERVTGLKPRLFIGTSMGAFQFGYRRVQV